VRSRPIIPPCFHVLGTDPCWWPYDFGHAGSRQDAYRERCLDRGVTVYNEEFLDDVPSPLILAIRSGRSDIVKILLEGGALPLTKGNWGEPKISVACGCAQ